MPVTEQRTPLKQPVVKAFSPLAEALLLPSNIQRRKFRVCLPCDDDNDAANDDVLEDSSQQFKNVHRRRSSGSRSSLYTHLDAYSCYFLQGLDCSDLLSLVGLSNTYLRSNAKFVGEQQSGSARYKIKVEFKSVHWASSIVTGFFQISGLIDEHPLITTCFKGEIINNPLARHVKDMKKFSFITEEKNWSSFPKNDLDHWKKLTGSPPNYTEEDLRKKLQKIKSGHDDPLLIYMRWKEEFLLPDSRVKLLTGASFEGLYYVVLNIGSGSAEFQPRNKESKLVPGTMSGLYFYTQSEKFQSLSLRYVEQRGMPQAYTFA